MFFFSVRDINIFRIVFDLWKKNISKLEIKKKDINPVNSAKCDVYPAIIIIIMIIIIIPPLNRFKNTFNTTLSYKDIIY